MLVDELHAGHPGVGAAVPGAKRHRRGHADVPRIEAETSLPEARVVLALDRSAEAPGGPRAISTGRSSRRGEGSPGARARRRAARPPSGRASDSPFIESFNDKVRDERLSQRRLDGLADARVTVENSRIDCNLNRPHSSLGNLTPCEFAAHASVGRRSAPPPSGPLKFEEPATL